MGKEAKKHKKPQEQAKDATDTPKESLQRSEKEIELIGDLQRLQAEFENFKKRMQQEQTLYKERASEEVLKDLLPIVDNLTLAIQNHTAKDEFSKGIELIYAQFIELLSNQGITRMHSLGETFSPTKHEALMTKESTGKTPNTIVEVLQEGYKKGERTMRTAKVVVGK